MKFDPQKKYPMEPKHAQIAAEIRKGRESLKSIDPQHIRPVVRILQQEAARTGRGHD